MRRLLVLASLVFALDAQAVTFDWVPVGNAGNAPDTPSTNCFAANCGSVAYDYWISKYEVTNAQYAGLLNAKAASDPLALYNTSMDSDASNGGITRSGSSGSYTYTAKVGFENKPVTYVSFYDSLRFSNWLNNGQGSGDTETGAYTLNGGEAIPSNGLTVTRNSGANIFLTSENEWYKAAYYSPDGIYFAYPAGSNDPTTCAFPGVMPNTANCGPDEPGAVTDVGAYTGSASPYGTFDQGGNVWEWNDELYFTGALRAFRGGSWGDLASGLAASAPNRNDPRSGSGYTGFRVASLVPEPGTGLLGTMGLLGVLGLAASRRRRAN
jgi:formylglycine-generating enzyme required for sulfatase activity